MPSKKTIAEYEICSGNSASECANYVNLIIKKDGFEPYGALIIQEFTSGNKLFVQVAVKYTFSK